MTTLANYQADVLRILHDPNLQTYTVVDVQSSINEARRQLAADTHCLRSLQTLPVSQASEVYTFGQINGYFISSGGSNYTSPTIAINGGGFTTQATATLQTTGGVITGVTITNPGAGYQPDQTPITTVITGGAGTGASITFGSISVNTLDILQVNVIWTQSRYTMDWAAWSEFSTNFRGWVNYQQRPVIWSQYGESSIYVGPIPDQPYICEVDTALIPVDMTSATTSDPISLMYQAPIKFYAAYLLKMKEQSFGEADWFLAQYQKRVEQAVVQTANRRIPSMYSQYGVSW